MKSRCQVRRFPFRRHLRAEITGHLPIPGLTVDQDEGPFKPRQLFC